jgi:hypothetical protein
MANGKFSAFSAWGSEPLFYRLDAGNDEGVKTVCAECANEDQDSVFEQHVNHGESLDCETCNNTIEGN